MIKLDMKLKKILGHKIVDNEYQFLIKWKDYDDEHNSCVVFRLLSRSLFYTSDLILLHLLHLVLP
jgi:hypothetical protein